MVGIGAFPPQLHMPFFEQRIGSRPSIGVRVPIRWRCSAYADAAVPTGCCATYRSKQVWFIHPEGRFRKTWDFTQSFLLIYGAFFFSFCQQQAGTLLRLEVGALLVEVGGLLTGSAVLLLVSVAIMVPLRMGFSMEAAVGDGDWYIELFVDMYFISDIVFNFRTGVSTHAPPTTT